jgi:hypothetical protein
MTSGTCVGFVLAIGMSYVINLAGDRVTLPEGATDASMAPYHVARSKLFVRERSAKAYIHLDAAQIEANIHFAESGRARRCSLPSVLKFRGKRDTLSLTRKTR